MPDDWESYSKLVLAELTRLNKCLSTTKKELVEVRIELAAMKVRAGVWGMAGAAIPIVIALVVALFVKKLG